MSPDCPDKDKSREISKKPSPSSPIFQTYFNGGECIMELKYLNLDRICGSNTCEIELFRG